MTLKSDAKFKENLPIGSKNDMTNFINFNSSSRKSGNLHFDGIFFLKLCNVSSKKMHRSWVVKKDLWFQK